MIDSSGNIYVTGVTSSADFPTTSGAYDTSKNGSGGSRDVFVSKLSSGLTALLASTYIGGSGEDFGYYNAIDTSGNIYVTGYTLSSDFPITTAAYDTSIGGSQDAFVSKLSGDLTTLQASTYLGGSYSADAGHALAIDPSGNIYVGGYTNSPDFPTTLGAYDTSGNSYEAFVSKLSNDLTTLQASTYLGGSSADVGYFMKRDSGGNIYVTGYTQSSDFPITSGAYDTAIGGIVDAFVSKLSGDLTTLQASTYLGGSGVGEWGESIALDSSGSIYVAGATNSSDFPTTTGAYDTSIGGSQDVFVSKLSSDLTILQASTYLGGSSNYDGYPCISIDSSGNIYIGGYTNSSDFPTTTGAYDTSLGSTYDMFISKLDSNLSAVSTSDTTAPSGSISINSGASYTNSSTVTLTLSATDTTGVTGYYLSDSSTTPSAFASGWTSVTSATSYSGSVSYTISGGEVSKTIYAWYKDAAGNVSSTASDTITLDTTAPTVSITSPTTSTTFTATSSTITLNGSASDSTSGISEVSWSNNKGGSGTASGTASWSISSISLSSGDNVITVTARDGAGNTNTDTITITYTATTAQPPAVTTGSATNVTSTSATLTGMVNANGLSTTAWFNYGVTSGSYTGTSTTQTISGSSATNVSATISGLSSNTNYYYRIVAQNSAGISYGTEANLTTSAASTTPIPTVIATPEPTPTVQPTPTKPPTLPPLPTLPPIPNISPTPSVECSQDGSISIQSINPPEGTVLGVGKMYTFTANVKYEFTTATKGSIGINAHDPNTGENLDDQTQNGVNVSSKSGEETVSVTTKISQNGNPVTAVGINVALFPDGYTCTYVSDRIQYKTDAASTTPAPLPTLPPTPTQKGGTVFGVVYDPDENPLKGVTVTITGKDSFLVISGDGGKKVTMANPESVLAVSTETDEDGYYEFVGLEVGVYALAYENEGYVTQTQEVSLKEGEVKELGTVIMEEVEKGKITGYVVNIKGDPIESVRLNLKGIKTRVKRSASSDADGYFEFEDLDADTYVVFAKKKGYRKTKNTVKLGEGESKEIEIEMRKTTRRKILHLETNL